MKKNKKTYDGPSLPILSLILGRNTVHAISARDLHQALGLVSPFSEWIDRTVDKHGLLEGREYFPARPKGNRGIRNCNSVMDDVIYLSLPTAKGICMAFGHRTGVTARKNIVHTETLLSGKYESSQIRPINKSSLRLEFEKRVFYWTMIKLELLIANGLQLGDGGLPQYSSRIKAELNQELDAALLTAFKMNRDKHEIGIAFISQWMPKFAKAIYQGIADVA